MKKLLISIAALATASAASASITPVLQSTTALGGGLYQFDYNATLASDQYIDTTSFFTLYDFFGYAGVASVPANWTVTTALLGQTPSKTLPDDDAGILNLTFNYTGPTLNENGSAPIDLGTFSVYSTSGTIVLDDFTSLGKLNKGPTKGTDVQTIGSNAIGVAGATVPEPATWAMMITGFGMVGFSSRRRARITSVTA